jgi:methionyl-tRNA synthetase
MPKKYLLTSALNYANGPLHLGHLLEEVQANLFARALRMDKRDVLYICGADSHGTPIEVNALKAQVPPADFAADWQHKHEASLKKFFIEFDGGYGSTHTPENEKHVGLVFQALKDQGYIKTKEIEQLFDPKLERFLPDRMVKGTCPKCHVKDQYGDSCEACGRTYQTTELIEPKSVLSGATPIMKKSLHYFVSLGQFEASLKEWMKNPHTVHEDIKASLERWFTEGLKDWDISRDGPYFGFLIPGETNKYFYVWLDAPIGYISISEKAALKRGRTFSDYWQDPSTEISHFIGKDITYFHTLFWPAMLMAAKYTLPHQIVVHGMLTIDGEKMSKSRGTFILADTFSKHINTEALRYYYACKLSKRAEDIDLNLNDFVQRVNADLVNKVVNLISRALPLLHRSFEGKAGALDKNDLVIKAQDVAKAAKDFYFDNEPAKAINEIIRLAEDANRYFQEKAPWGLIAKNKEEAHKILTTGLYIGKVCLSLLKPALPNTVKSLEKILNNGYEYDFSNLLEPFKVGQQFEPYEHLFTRIEEKSVKEIMEESKSSVKAPEPQTAEIKTTNIIDIKQFMDVDLRAAKVLKAEVVEGSDKLIACTLDVGELGIRNVFSGLRPHLGPNDLVGQTVVVVANLAPRKMRFGMSEGMILACGSDDKPVLLTINGATPGSRIG